MGDNTGFSTGPHCHTQWRRINWNGGTNYTTVDINEANNSFDPTQFYTGATPTPPELGPADKIAVMAAEKETSGDSKTATMLWAVVNFIKAFGK